MPHTQLVQDFITKLDNFYEVVENKPTPTHKAPILMKPANDSDSTGLTTGSAMGRDLNLGELGKSETLFL